MQIYKYIAPSQKSKVLYKGLSITHSHTNCWLDGD